MRVSLVVGNPVARHALATAFKDGANFGKVAVNANRGVIGAEGLRTNDLLCSAWMSGG